MNAASPIALHERLAEDLPRFAREAGIVPSWVSTPLSETCSEPEVEWVRKFRRLHTEQISGLCYTTVSLAEVNNRMAAICGALLRNFVRARVVTARDVAKNGDVDVSCLLIPNFFAGKGSKLSDWDAANIVDVMIARHQRGVQTVIYVSNMLDMETLYGAAAADIVKGHYTII